jgi:hypothetical protein
MPAWTCVPPLLLVAACGANAGGPSYALAVGSDDGGGGSFGGGAGPASGALDAAIQENHITVTFVTLSCSGACANVEAVASGGQPPYTFAWDDGPTQAARSICATSNTTYQVEVTDTGTSGEFVRPVASVKVRLAADVLACPDGGGPDAGAGTQVARVTVPSTADVWLAGQPDGTSLPMSMYSTGTDAAPANSPVEVPVVAGSTLTFAVTGMASNAFTLCYPPTPDGIGGCLADATAGPANGLSSLESPGNSLIGVFLDGSVPAGQPPPGLNAIGANGSFAMLSPLLRQVFFIGDGLTGSGTGAVQRFVAPPGATRLFLADLDGLGQNYDNSGQFVVIVSIL